MNMITCLYIDEVTGKERLKFVRRHTDRDRSKTVTTFLVI